MSNLCQGQRVRLTPAFCARHKGFPWMADLVGTYTDLVHPDAPQAAVLWQGHERPQYVAIHNLERV